MIMSALEQFITSPFHKPNQPKKKYKLKYLSDKAQNFFREGIKLFHDCFVLSGEHYSSTGRLKQQLKEAQRIAEETDDFSEVHKILQTINSRRWYCHYNKILQNKDTWNTFKTAEGINQDKMSKLDALHRKWERHEQFSHYTSDALLFAADILKELEDHLNLAKQEFIRYRNKLGKVEDQTKYETYINLFLQTVQQQKIALCEAMFARWKLALESNNMTQDDVTVHLVQQLNQLGVIEDKDWIERQRPRQTKEHNESLFIKFHHYIAQNGTSELKKTVGLSLSWRLPPDEDSHSTVPIIPIERAGNAFLIPKQLEVNIPAYRRKPNFLFKGNNFRYEFFQDKKDLFLRLIQLRALKINITHYQELSEDPLWIELHTTQRFIESAINISRQQKTTGFFARYRQESNQFLEKWEQLLLDQQKIVILYQLEFLEYFVNHADFLKHLLEEPALEESTVREIQSMFNNLHETLSTLVVAPRQMDRMLYIGNRLFGLFHRENTFRVQAKKVEKINQSLQQLITGAPIESEQFKDIMHYYSEISIFKRDELKEQKASSIKTISQSLLDFLNNQPAPLKELTAKTFMNWVEQCTQLIYQYGDRDTLTSLEKSVEQFITRYREYLTHQGNLIKENNELWMGLEALVDKIAPVRYASQITDLKIAREFLVKRNSSESSETRDTLGVLFRSSDNSCSDSNHLISNTHTSKTLEEENLKLKKRLEESQALRRDVEAIINGRPFINQLQGIADHKNSVKGKQSDEITEDSSTHKSDSTSFVLTPDLLAFRNRLFNEITQEWQEKQTPSDIPTP
jgi:hypothetical protein